MADREKKFHLNQTLVLVYGKTSATRLSTLLICEYPYGITTLFMGNTIDNCLFEPKNNLM